MLIVFDQNKGRDPFNSVTVSPNEEFQFFLRETVWLFVCVSLMYD